MIFTNIADEAIFIDGEHFDLLHGQCGNDKNTRNPCKSLAARQLLCETDSDRAQ